MKTVCPVELSEHMHFIVQNQNMWSDPMSEVHLDGRVAGGVTDPHRPAAHGRRDVTAVELGHGSSLLFSLKLKVGLRGTRTHGRRIR